MAGKKVTRFRPSPQEPQEQRFIDYAGAADFYWRLSRLVGMLELMSAEPVTEHEDLQRAVDVMADMARRITDAFTKDVLFVTYTVGPGERVKEIPAPV